MKTIVCNGNKLLAALQHMQLLMVFTFFVLIQVVPLLMMFLPEFLSFNRKVPQSFFVLWLMLQINVRLALALGKFVNRGYFMCAKNRLIVLKFLQNKGYKLPPFLKACPDCSGLVPIARGLSRLLGACPDCSGLVPIARGLSRLLGACPDCSGLVPI
ncbi:hypothetical protein C7N43_36930, partial [Sphingobacteriales bacterium UPWRP_1]